MRLTVISHSCAIDTNQQLFAELEGLGVTLQLIVPEAWRGDLTGQLLPPTRWEGLRAPLTPVPVVMPGKVPLHFYRTSLARHFYQFQPDAIYVENECYALSTFQGAMANRLSMRRPFLFRNNQNLDKRYPWINRRMERFVLEQATCANVINQDAGALLRSRGYRGRVAYMPYGVDPEFYRPSDARPLRESLGLRGFVFGYMGRLVEEKGLDLLLDAFARFHPEEDVTLLIIGDGPMRPLLEKRIASPSLSTRVRLLPVVPHREAPVYLAAMHALVLPSLTRPGWKEQFGRVLIEAPSCGVPVIGTDSGEIPYLIERTRAGLVVPEGNVPALHEAMRRLCESPQLHDRLREAGRIEVEQQFGYPALAYRFKQLLEAIVGEHRRGGSGEDDVPDWATAWSEAALPATGELEAQARDER